METKIDENYHSQDTMRVLLFWVSGFGFRVLGHTVDARRNRRESFGFSTVRQSIESTVSVSQDACLKQAHGEMLSAALDSGLIQKEDEEEMRLVTAVAQDLHR